MERNRGKNPRYNHNNHHVLFYRRIWDSMEYMKQIRGDHRLQVPLNLDAHEDLHRNVDMVPTMPMHLGMRAYSVFREYGDAHDPVDNIQNFMRSIESAMEEPRQRELTRTMGENTIWALEQQLPYIQDGYVDLSQYGTTQYQRVA